MAKINGITYPGVTVEKSPYNPKFVKKVQDARNGNFTTVTDVKEFMRTL